MRRSYAHEAVLIMAPEADLQAPGAAITVALCGQWEHPPPCPLAAHHTAAERDGDRVRLRTLFATDPRDEPLVRRRLDQALARGEQAGPDGRAVRWRVERSRPSEVADQERDHAGRLERS